MCGMFASIFTLCIQTFDKEVEIRVDNLAIISPPKEDNIINAVLIPTTKKIYHDSEIYQYFIDKALERKIDIIYNIPFADCLINCESGWNPNSKNASSTAYGLGQFLTSTWNNTNKALGGNLERDNPYHQIDAFTYLLSTDGYRHWIVWPKCIYLLPIEKRIKSL